MDLSTLYLINNNVFTFYHLSFSPLAPMTGPQKNSFTSFFGRTVEEIIIRICMEVPQILSGLTLNTANYMVLRVHCNKRGKKEERKRP